MGGKKKDFDGLVYRKNGQWWWAVEFYMVDNTVFRIRSIHGFKTEDEAQKDGCRMINHILITMQKKDPARHRDLQSYGEVTVDGKPVEGFN